MTSRAHSRPNHRAQAGRGGGTSTAGEATETLAVTSNLNPAPGYRDTSTVGLRPTPAVTVTRARIETITVAYYCFRVGIS